MQETRSNFNNLSIYGKVVGKPEYFDGIMAFTLYQEDNNLSMQVVYEKELPLKQGEIVDVRGKLSFDAEDEILILHAQAIIQVERAPKVFSKPVKTEQSIVEDTPTETSVETLIKEDDKDVELVVSPEVTAQTEDKAQPTAPVETIKEVAAPMPVATQTPTAPTKEEQSFRLFKVSEDAPPESTSPEVSVETPPTPVTPEQTPVVTEEEAPPEQVESETEAEGYSLNDFNC